MKILELFSGTECLSNAFRARGHECFTVDWDTRFPSSLHTDIMQLTAQRILTDFGRPDIIWAGCDCTTFSVAAIGHHRRRDPATGSLLPKTVKAARADEVNRHTLRIIRSLRPRFFFIENPMGGLRWDGLHAGHTPPPDNLLSVRLHLPPGPPTSGRTTRSPSSCRRAGTATPATSRHPVAPSRDCRAYRTGHCARHIPRSCASTSSASANGTSTASRCPSVGTSTPSRPCRWSCFEHGLHGLYGLRFLRPRIDTN